MKEPLNSIAEIIANANDSFTNTHNSLDIILGISEKALRQQGIPADAITLDCPARDKKIVFLLHDEQADKAEIAFGNKQGDIFSTEKIDLVNLSVAKVLSLMEAYLLAH